MDPEILFFDEPSAGLDPIIAAGIDQLILELKKAFHMTIIVVTHELASAFLIADRMVLINKGDLVASGTVAEMRNSKHPRVRQFLDRVPEPAVAQELDYLQMLTEPSSKDRRGTTGEEQVKMESKREQVWVGLFVIVAATLLIVTVFVLTGAFAGSAKIFHTRFHNVAGLEPGATVRYAGGPKIGRVEKIEIDPNDPVAHGYAI